MKRELMTLAATVGLTMTANAAIIAQPAGSEDPFTLTQDALGESAIVTSSGGIVEDWSNTLATLQDNSLGTGGTAGASSSIGVTSATSITYTFDTSGSNSRGYDLTKIQTYAGWNYIYGIGRSNQGYAVELTFVGGATTTLLNKDSWATDPIYWTRVTLVNDADPGVALLATGVKSVTFTNFENATAYHGDVGAVAYREIDIYGTTTVPEPAVASLLLLGAAAFSLRRRN